MERGVATLEAKAVQSPTSYRVVDRLLAVWIALAAAIWSLLSLASELREGDLTAFDQWVLLALRQPGQPHVPIGPIWLTECMRDITALGGVTLGKVLGSRHRA